MRTVGDLYEASLKVDVNYLAGLALANSGEEYIRIQQEQIFAGERADGTPIFNTKTGSEYYSDSYARHKGKDHPIDLKDTGSFYNLMFTRQESEGLAIDSEDPKADMLTDTYEPWLLNDFSKEQFIPFVARVYIEEVSKEMNK